jgi:hypothetical protein
MKRDWELIREVLLRLEEKPADKDVLVVNDFPEDKRDAVAYHVNLSRLRRGLCFAASEIVVSSVGPGRSGVI